MKEKEYFPQNVSPSQRLEAGEIERFSAYPLHAKWQDYWADNLFIACYAHPTKQVSVHNPAVLVSLKSCHNLKYPRNLGPKNSSKCQNDFHHSVWSRLVLIFLTQHLRTSTK